MRLSDLRKPKAAASGLTRSVDVRKRVPGTSSPDFVPGLPHVILIESRQALISHQDYHMLLLTLAGTLSADWTRARSCDLEDAAKSASPAKTTTGPVH